MSIGILLPLILIVGVMFMMTRSQKTKQRQALEMRNKMEPGTGVRTIGGMYAVVKEVNDETVLLEITDGVHAHFAKSAIGTVLSEEDFNRIVHGIEPEEPAEDGAEAAAEDTEPADGVADADEAHDGTEEHISLDKSGAAAEQDDSAAQDEPVKEPNGSASK
ncbi:preprotein translocase subunit YajC [Actinacidiphila yanglinensis]|uniref:Preprotein translocase subunit YajC n=1 Tax=Actinacidiphila yanglinensis TaxID=310779 RepID=A0A1H6CKA4_9ACTN|nr:preprotein translocase subunit YajC [Actinacidiphila yanglinensis]SEG73414.1 preprotein translocase subunit YajC [Actinacidiphila yanglinensis]